MSDPPDPEADELGSVDSGAANVVDPAKIQRRARDTRRKVKREEDERREFWTRLLSTPIGRREMWGILDSGHAFDERFANGPAGFPDNNATWLQAGEQRLAFRLYLSWLKLAPVETQLMLAENHPALARETKQ